MTKLERKSITLLTTDLTEKEKVDSASNFENTSIVPSFQYLTNHLRGFDLFNSALGLTGNEYRPLAKLHWYAAISTAAVTKTIRVAIWNVDTRLSTVNILPPGHGKKNLGKIHEKIAEALKLEFGNPASYHPESLVGKKLPIYEGKGKARHVVGYEENFGYLSKDVVLFDECKTLLEPEKRSPQEQSRVYIRRALDPYGDNWLEKPQVDVKLDKPLRYLARSRIHMFTQPRRLNSELVTEGYIRRTFFGLVEFKGNERGQKIKELLKNTTENSEEDFIEFMPVLDLVKSVSGKEITLSQEAKKELSNLYDYVVSFGESYGDNAAEETKTEEFTIVLDHAKLAILYALSQGRSTVSAQDIQYVFPDFIEFLDMKWRFMNGWLSGRVSFTGEFISDGDETIVQYLKERGAVSLEKSNVKNWEIIAEIQKAYSKGGKIVAERTAKWYLKKLIQKGLVLQRQVSKTDFLVFLQPLAKTGDFDYKDCKDNKGYNNGWLSKYVEICSIISSLKLTDLPESFGSLHRDTHIVQPMQPLQPSKGENAETVGGEDITDSSSGCLPAHGGIGIGETIGQVFTEQPTAGRVLPSPTPSQISGKIVTHESPVVLK